MGVLRLVLGIAAIVLGLLVLLGATLGSLSDAQVLGIGVACAGGAALL